MIVLIGRPVATCIGSGFGVTSIAARLGQAHIFFWGQGALGRQPPKRTRSSLRIVSIVNEFGAV